MWRATVDQAREERARLQGEVASLKQRLAEAEAANEEMDQVRGEMDGSWGLICLGDGSCASFSFFEQDRGLLAAMVFTLKKQVAQYEQAAGAGVKMEG